VNERHLGTRIVYYRVVPSAAPAEVRPPGRQFYGKLNVKPETEFTGWLERELAKRTGMECVETMADFRRLPRGRAQ
jgi:uncharacterized protein YPO0396